MFPSSVEWHVPCLIRSLKKNVFVLAVNLQPNQMNQIQIPKVYFWIFLGISSPTLWHHVWPSDGNSPVEIASKSVVLSGEILRQAASSWKFELSMDGLHCEHADGIKGNRVEFIGNHGNLGCILYLFWNHHITRLTPLNYLLVWRFYCTLWKCLMASWISKLLLNLYQWFGERPHNNPHIWNPHK